MTTNSRFHQAYVKSTETEDPKVLISLRFPWLTLLKMLILGEYANAWHSLSDSEIEALSKSIVRWRLVKKLRSHKQRAR